MYLLIPGRHHVLSQFQSNYLSRMVHSKMENEKDIKGEKVKSDKIDGIVFAVTSANHQKTRRNPLSYNHRQLAIHSLNKELPVSVYSFPITDTGKRDDFASYTIKTILHESDGLITMNPENTIVICSTPVLRLYEKLGYIVLGAEAPLGDFSKYTRPLPWEIVEKIACTENWDSDPYVLSNIYKGSLEILKQYNLDKTIRFAFNDPFVGDDGDLTETRNYSSYVRQMDEIAELKFSDVKKHILPGRIGDIGCAVGSWLKLATEEQKLIESDFFGIELARQLYQTCEQRKSNREFSTPNIWFSQKNAVTGNVFQANSMNTIHSSSLTHEIESYGSREDLLSFIKNRYEELQPGGIWINRDVIGPEEKNELCLLELDNNDGNNKGWDEPITDPGELKKLLDCLSTKARFYRFALDFRNSEHYKLQFREVELNNSKYIELREEDAAEFLLTKDYTDNWQSEMHERFCFWSLSDWKKALEEVGFTVLEDSCSFTNPWIVQNRFINKTKLFSLDGKSKPYPVTNGIIIGQKKI